MSAAAIVLSSSPPRVFARSPTSIDSSPSLPSPSDLFNFDAEVRHRFRLVKKAREGLGNDFTTAKSLLGVKRGAENVPFRSPGREKFKHHEIAHSLRSPRFILEKPLEKTINGRKIATSQASSRDNPEQTTEHASKADEALSDTRTNGIALPRRKDWTPKEKSPSQVDALQSPTSVRGGGFAEGLMRSFSFEDNSTTDDIPSKKRSSDDVTNKRTRVDLVAGVPPRSLSRAKQATAKESVKNAVHKRKKSPAKKPMTITKLATALYHGQGDPQKDSPMAQYLSATQARVVEDGDGEAVLVEGSIQVSVTKSKVRKRAGQRTKLMSPQSALKAVEAQQTVFGSASQLARDDKVATQTPNDPFSTQQTQPISIESTTPQTGRGLSRFARAKNLWNVSARDEDDALLHVESVDMFDTPNVRSAFAGKDALSIGRAVGVVGSEAVADVDDFASPLVRVRPVTVGAVANRPYHTSAAMASPRKAAAGVTPSDQQLKSAGLDETQRVTKPKVKRAAPKKPSYAGLSTSDLQKQISAFGFKPVKKREKMVDLLELCWEQKHGKQDDTATDEINLKHGDILSKVHDVSSRPQPKVTKPKKRTKDEQSEKSPKKPSKRQKSAVPVAEGSEVPKRRRKTQVQTPALADTDVIDIDDAVLAETTWAATKHINHLSARNLTPPPSEPFTLTDIDNDESMIQGETQAPVATPPLPESKAIGEQIYAAIMKQSELEIDGERNHLRNPTWHEKLLLYDPIVLEDLTVWLNTDGLGLIGEDREVSAMEVREWCEAKSICCLWKGGWRGNKKTSTED